MEVLGVLQESDVEMNGGSTRYEHKRDYLVGTRPSFSETTDIFTGEIDEDSTEAF